jgi:ribosomal protein S18 acetylase RimI-like enzyme
MDQIHRVTPLTALTEADQAAIRRVADACRRRDGQEPWLYLDASSGPSNDIPYFRADGPAGEWAGFASLTPGNPAEAYLAVHPDQRRRGIGRALLEAARIEARRRGVERVLLVADAASAAGDAFATAVGATFVESEFCLEFDPGPAAVTRVPSDALRLVRADASDAATLARIQAISFGDLEETHRDLVAGWLAEGDAQRFYLARRGGETVGSLRVSFQTDGSAAYINTFGVLPEYRGRGYGRQMLRDAVATLRAEGWRHIRIEVATTNPVALSLYRSSGFREIAAYRYYELAS